MTNAVFYSAPYLKRVGVKKQVAAASTPSMVSTRSPSYLDLLPSPPYLLSLSYSNPKGNSRP